MYAIVPEVWWKSSELDIVRILYVCILDLYRELNKVEYYSLHIGKAIKVYQNACYMLIC